MPTQTLSLGLCFGKQLICLKISPRCLFYPFVNDFYFEISNWVYMLFVGFIIFETILQCCGSLCVR